MKNALLLLCCALCLSCSRPVYVEFTGYAQGGVWQVKANLQGVSADRSTLQRGMDSLLTAIDASLSGYNRGSVLSRHNRGELSGDVRAREEALIAGYDAMFLKMLELAQAAWTLTDGKVDASAAALFDAWGFGFKHDSLPSAALVDSLKALAGSFSLRRPDGQPQRFNFNAMAQGYSSDILAAYLRENGVKDMLVNVGGEMVCTGVNAAGKPWKLGIDAPYDGNDAPGRKISGIFSVSQVPAGVVTSGNYRKFYIKDGVKYAHTIDPSTGRPVVHSLRSATIIVGPDCPLIASGAPFEGYPAALADALATFCMVVGTEPAVAFVEAHPGVEACLISGDAVPEAWTGDALQENYRVWKSEGFPAE
ncbi:MAG: FAD:protein FMN transferase [Bacteroidales bacterium]|nr:FAD:protein FMN transferase [Bacteroidales bacterium]